jgi:superfamily II RNA helicase
MGVNVELHRSSSSYPNTESVSNSLTATGLDLITLFPFELDGFQLEAIEALNAGKSVVVCAPTGSGKTLIGEYAIHRALAQGKRVFYTTPLKALSNQKLRDFRDRFGHTQVGLLTGDVSVNRDAPILVMTTEIFRNMLYGTPIGEVGTSLTGLEAVVLDECHYMNDRQRGTVWEESIIYCPPEVQLVALSATIANSDQLTDWIDQVHGPTQLIYSDFRPVPLRFFFCNPRGLFPLLNTNQKSINPKLKGGRNRGHQETPALTRIISHLQERDMLPAIYFIFSRKGCDQAVSELGELSLLNADEAAKLKAQVDDFLKRNPEAVRQGHLAPLYRGVAAHHAGVLPAWKGLIEELFQQGLIKVVFATETLAAGINMPARTTVISSLSKRTDRGHRLLNASEFLQMAGRAGRRGMDEVGYVVTVQTRFEGASEAAFLATSKAEPLISQFTPSYGMVLNLLQTHTLEQARELIERSFGQYLAMLRWQPQQQELSRLEAEQLQQQEQLAGVDPKILADYEKLQERLKEGRRLLKTLQQQAQEVLDSELAIALTYAVAGTTLGLKGKHVSVAAPLPAVLVSKIPGSGQFPYFVCLGRDNHWYVVAVADIVGLYAEYPRLVEVDHLSLPIDLPLKLGQSRPSNETTLALAQQIRTLPAESLTAPEIQTQAARVAAVEAQLQNHAAHQWGSPGSLLKRQKRIESLLTEIRDRRSKLNKNAQRYWQEFLDLTKVLREFGCLEDSIPTEMGQSVAAIRGDNELWLGLALTSGKLDDLAPHHFATVCAVLVTEISRSDSWTNYELSPEVEEALKSIRGLRQDLIKAQNEYDVEILVLPAEWRDRKLTALVEQWALGVEWNELCSNTSFDEGDVVRILRRTLDLLSQVPHVPHLPNKLRDNANRAIQLIDRFPVNEEID